MQAALCIVERASSEISIDITRKDSTTELFRQMEGSWSQVDDFSNETYFIGLLTGILKDALSDFALHLCCQMGIVDAKVTRDGSLTITAIQRDIMIGIAIVVELADGSIDSDIVLLLFAKLSCQGDIGRQLSEVLIGENLMQADAISTQLTFEDLIGGDIELRIDRSCTRTNEGLERCVALKRMVKGSCELEVSDTPQFLRYLRDDFRKEIETVLREVYMIHLQVPGRL